MSTPQQECEREGVRYALTQARRSYVCDGCGKAIPRSRTGTWFWRALDKALCVRCMRLNPTKEPKP